MWNLLMVAVGGALGSVCRYLLSLSIYRLFDEPLFPYGLITVNVLGCFLIGILAAVFEARAIFSPAIRLFLMVGFLGGFTTFSSFGLETFTLLHEHQLSMALIEVVVQVVVGVAAVWLGFVFSKAVLIH